MLRKALRPILILFAAVNILCALTFNWIRSTGIDPDVLLYTPDYWTKVESSRVKYHLYYISHCLKRIEDINWCLTHRLKFYEYSSLQLFNLIKLKEKLSLENAEPVEEFYTI